ncbi:hypothetical protein FQA45_15895 [Glutamicibacter halophytocola]|uniref:Uncharacterized protein n=1 Tax=Glutamicibacter halophytocola TaxID=1933880 RepID=A0ABX5YDB1_9MICC|nr:DUF6176 family protein [Glutamicibacter halophytocola]NQD42109.1 hypothetical protein [Glutamicibacter halophytocola]QDY67667.1 hypothetical protein FQA45_15895 [Glutamicibacter halophytocola]
MDNTVPNIPFRPAARDFEGHSKPLSVPKGLRLELSRAKIIEGKEETFEEWMSVLNDRYDECLASIPAQRAVFEATFRHEEADGSAWMYHLSLMGTDGVGLNEEHAIDATHASYARQAKEPGWEELTPKFMLTPDHIRSAMLSWANSGEEPR